VAHPLDGAGLRLVRADRHLAEALDLVKAFSLACVDHIVPDGHGHFILERFPQIPPELSVVTSDIIHNLRAALDYIVYELALKDSGKIQNSTQFLIEDMKIDPVNPKRGFDARSKQYLKGLNQRHIDAIEGLQPYTGVEWTKTLRDISNPDKHRTLILLSSEGRLADVRAIHSPTGRFCADGQVTADGIPDRYDFEFNAYNAIAIASTDPSEPPLMRTLRRLEAEVSRTIELFKPEF
jgi:hypothetical protein